MILWTTCDCQEISSVRLLRTFLHYLPALWRIYQSGNFITHTFSKNSYLLYWVPEQWMHETVGCPVKPDASSIAQYIPRIMHTIHAKMFIWSNVTGSTCAARTNLEQFGVGVTKVMFIYFSNKAFISCSYLPGVIAAALQWLLSNMNVVLNS